MNLGAERAVAFRAIGRYLNFLDHDQVVLIIAREKGGFCSETLRILFPNTPCPHAVRDKVYLPDAR
jgi:hypothetical protein